MSYDDVDIMYKASQARKQTKVSCKMILLRRLFGRFIHLYLPNRETIPSWWLEDIRILGPFLRKTEWCKVDIDFCIYVLMQMNGECESSINNP